MFERVAIVNRGEPAMRFIRAARELSVERGVPLRSIAFYTDAERDAMFVREADEAVRIHSAIRNPYLDHDALEQGLREARAEAVWVGWGFVAEDPSFADRVEAMGLVFIGPTGDTMRRLGDKIGAKLLAQSCGVPVAPWSGGPVADLEGALQAAEEIGYPLMVKAAAGGGGRGIRLVEEHSRLKEALEAARREAEAAFGDGTVFLEKLVVGGHHVEVQVIADGRGGVWALGVRDCSLQRRHQKLVEESASTVLDEPAEQRAKASASALARAAAYRGAGTVEFLYQPEEKLLAFLEVNTRLQVEHTVTEVTTGVDVVKLQLHVAAGGLLGPAPPPPRGHAIEVRLNAEDPGMGFAPAPGIVERLAWASGPGVRVETGVAQGDVIPPDYDSMIAKVIGYGQSREEARARVLRALRETTVVIRGGMTNKAFLADLVDHPDFVAGRVDTSWLDRLMDSGAYKPADRRQVALVAAAIETYRSYREAARREFFLAASRGRPQTDVETGRRVELRSGGEAYSLDVLQTGPGSFRVLVDGFRLDVATTDAGPFEKRLAVAGQSFRVLLVRQGPEVLVEVDGLPHRVSEDDGGLVRAPSPGVVVDVAVSEGDEVGAGTRLATLESMKMEVGIEAPMAGRVKAVLAAVGVPVEGLAPLFQIEAASAGADAEAAGGRADFSELIQPGPAGPAQAVARSLEELRMLVLGYDYPRQEADAALQVYRRERAKLPPGDTDALRSELEVLRAFADLALLSRNREVGPEEAEEGVHVPREFFHAFLQTMDISRAGLPASFEAKLRSALACYGVEGMERSPVVEDALLWMFLAQRRTAERLPAVLAVLESIRALAEVPAELHEELLGALDRLVVATQLRHPVVGQLARSARFALFDYPVIKAEREAVFSEMRDHLSALAAGCEPEERAAHMEALVACPVQLIGLMASLSSGRDEEWRELIEVQTRRYYSPYSLARVHRFERDGRRLVAGEFLQGGEETLVVATEAATAEPAELAAALGGVATEVGAAKAAVADLYVRKGDPEAREALGRHIEAALELRPLPEGLRRVTVSIPVSGEHVARRTFSRDGSGFAEDPLLYDLHPMIAERLHLWRLSEFDLRRLPAPEDVYLFEATARSNRSDQRLLALAEVRELTPLRGASGAVVAIPALEQVLDSCLDGMRRAMFDRAPAEPPQWNRIVLHVWPVIELGEDDLLRIVRALAPRTEGLGLEQVGVQGRLQTPEGLRQVRLRLARSPGGGVSVRLTPVPELPMRPLDAYGQKVLQARRRGTVFPYELIPLLLRPPGEEAGQRQGAFTEYDLGEDLQPRPVERPYGQNTSAIVFGTVTTPTVRYPEGMTRVAVFGDPTKSLGSVAEPECRRIIAAVDLAQSLHAPLEWFAVCSGAKIAMDSGTENMDWVSRVLRRLIEFTQGGGEVNVVVAGINVGAQPYWNAEATMLMHTKGILVMTPDSAMVLTGKQSLEYSGGVAAEDNFGIGGYDRVMGPNGQAQYWVPDLAGASRLLLAHYELTYVAPGERFPRRAPTEDPVERDVRLSPHQVPGLEFATIGDIFSAEANPERKKPFDIRTLMRAVIDYDSTPLERWAGMRDAETGVVFDARLGGHAVTLIGIESRTVPRLGLPPPDGPASWSGGTLYPESSKKVARGINAASGSRPVVVLANLSGFDGSPESLRKLQLEYGAEIGRAIVNFDGPIVFCVVSRYHGGAFVVFSAVLNDHLEVAAVEGSFASVIGGAPAAAVVFTGEVRRRTESDPRMLELAARIAKADEVEAARLRSELERLRAEVRAEKQAEVAAEFDRIHSIDRAKEVGSVHVIIPAARLRPYLIEAVERGMSRFAKAPAG